MVARKGLNVTLSVFFLPCLFSTPNAAPSSLAASQIWPRINGLSQSPWDTGSDTNQSNQNPWPQGAKIIIV